VHILPTPLANLARHFDAARGPLNPGHIEQALRFSRPAARSGDVLALAGTPEAVAAATALLKVGA
jgi:hypothetical protein